MKNARSTNLIAGAAALAASLLFSMPAHAQYRVGEDGHARDANTRIGSGGYNGNRTNYPYQYGTGSNIINNEVNGQIVTGNVNGLNYFHGQTSEFDPNVFQSRLGTTSNDRFLAISQASDINARTTGATNVVPYYTTDKLVNIPQNFSVKPNGVGVVPSSEIKNTPNDTRLGDINTGAANVLLPTPGELDLPGPVDPSGNQSSLVASPLFGMRQFSMDDAGDAYFLSRYSNVPANGPVQAARANNAQIQQMRTELNSTMIPNSSDSANPNNPTNPNGVTPANTNLNQSQAITGSSAQPSNGAISNQPLSTSINDQPLNGSANPAVGMRNQFTALIPADQQSAQLKDLVQRLAKVKQQSPEQAAQSYNELRRLNAIDQQKAADAKTDTAPGATPPANGQTPAGAPPTAIAGAPDTNAPLKTPDVTPAPMDPILSAPLTGGNDKPYVITSLATGIKAKGLADLLTGAEALMRQGKFSNALDTYDRAPEVAPNNPFPVLGRAFAELGGGTYRRAETDLRRAFMAESGAVLLGQYDLRGFLGEDRLKYVVKDLKAIDSKEKNEQSAFLLAYIAHNVGDDDSAARLLNDAEQRAGGKDEVIDLMRQNWQLKSPAAK